MGTWRTDRRMRYVYPILNESPNSQIQFLNNTNRIVKPDLEMLLNIAKSLHTFCEEGILFKCTNAQQFANQKLWHGFRNLHTTQVAHQICMQRITQQTETCTFTASFTPHCIRINATHSIVDTVNFLWILILRDEILVLENSLNSITILCESVITVKDSVGGGTCCVCYRSHFKLFPVDSLSSIRIHICFPHISHAHSLPLFSTAVLFSSTFS